MMSRVLKFRQATIRAGKFDGWHYWGWMGKGDFVAAMGLNSSPHQGYQFTGLVDKNGKDIYEGDLLNICFTSDSGEFIHDCIYKARMSDMDGLCFDYVNLLWSSDGYNQYPINMTLNSGNKLSTIYGGDRQFLCVQDVYNGDPDLARQFPFNQEKELSFHSRYFEVIGDIYTNPELVKA